MTIPVFLLMLGMSFEICTGCGIVTHTEIGHRASEYFVDKTGGVDYKKLILANQDAFQSGNVYPDAFYSTTCKGGRFHQVSEDSHWVPFLNATINYIRRVYPKPWVQETEKLVVFMLGFASHQVADVSWHSLGIDQGFLSTMADVNFHGIFSAAHSVGDVGGDIVTAFEFDLSYIDSLTEWYVPTKDLVAIYKDLYGRDIINGSVIEDCTMQLFLERLGEKLAIDKTMPVNRLSWLSNFNHIPAWPVLNISFLRSPGRDRLFPYYASKSPFLVEQFQSYFLGSLDDMSTWSTNYWHNAIHMLEKGTRACTLPRNPLYVNCNVSKTTRTSSSIEKTKKLSGRRTNRNLYGLTSDLLRKRQTGRGVYFSASRMLQRKIKIHQEKKSKAVKATREKLKLKTSPSYLKSILTTSNAYAHLGWSLLTADVNGDKIIDLIVGAPGYSEPGNTQNGRIFIVFGKDSGLPKDLDLDTSADLTLSGSGARNGRFGSAIAVLDFNQDGMPDLAVSAPSSGSMSLNYTGAVHVYLAISLGVFNSSPNFTITCRSKYCNLGWSLATADLNQDGCHDLIIGSPFVASNVSGQEQRQSGALWVVYSTKKTSDNKTFPVESEGTILLEGDQQYGWLGYNVMTKSKMKGQGSWLLVSQPTYRICAKSDCSFSPADVQSVGRVLMYDTLNMTKPIRNITGRNAFSKLGSSFGIGDPYDNNMEILAVGSDTANVEGKIIDVSTTFQQAGRVDLSNLLSSSDWIKTHRMHQSAFRSNVSQLDIESQFIAALEGDRRLARFGESLLIEDVTGDGIDDIVISSPMRINDVTEELYGGEQGTVYIFKGGSSFPRGNITRQCDLLHKFIEPCPGDKSLVTLTGYESGTRFGHSLTVWKTQKTTSLVVSAPRSSRGARLSGSVFVYSVFD